MPHYFSDFLVFAGSFLSSIGSYVDALGDSLGGLREKVSNIPPVIIRFLAEASEFSHIAAGFLQVILSGIVGSYHLFGAPDST